jgi:hypothetical protein
VSFIPPNVNISLQPLIPPDLDIANITRDEAVYLLPAFLGYNTGLFSKKISLKKLKEILYDRRATQNVALNNPDLKAEQIYYLEQKIKTQENIKEFLTNLFFWADGQIEKDEYMALQQKLLAERDLDSRHWFIADLALAAKQLGIKKPDKFALLFLTNPLSAIKSVNSRLFKTLYRTYFYWWFIKKANDLIEEYENQIRYLNYDTGPQMLKVLAPNFLENLNKYNEGLTPSIWSLYPEQRDKYLRKKKIKKGVQTVGTFSLLASIATIFLSR